MPLTFDPRGVDQAFRSATGVTERRHYKIFYSHIHPFPLLTLGFNPGGGTDGTDLTASETFFENWEHDFLRFRNEPQYALANPMCSLLAAALQTNSVDALRQVPATNLIFRRSRNTDTATFKPGPAAAETAPFLRSIIQAVNPTAILLIAKTAYDLFVRFHCEKGSVVESSRGRVFTPNGASTACIFLAAQASVLGLEGQVPLFMVGHPSKYGSRREWPTVVQSLTAGLEACRVSPISQANALVPIPPLPSYGTSL